MATFGRNTAINLLRGLGVSESERRKFNEIRKYYEENDLYENIASRNLYAFGEEISPMQLNYNNLVEILSSNPDISISDILSSYQDNINAYNSGSTTQIDNFVSRYTEELQDMGVVVSEETVKDILITDPDRFELLELYKAAYLRYEVMGDSKAMGEVLKSIQEVINGTLLVYETLGEKRKRGR